MMPRGSAVLSECGTYRYRLDRWGFCDYKTTDTALAFIMVNPSTADADNDDATIRKCMGFCARRGVDRLIVGNLFAYRSKDVRVLAAAGAAALGPDNDMHLSRIMRDASRVVVAWGPLAKLPAPLRGRWRDVVKIAREFNHQLDALGVASDGQPRHPLMLSYAAPLTTWRLP